MSDLARPITTADVEELCERVAARVELSLHGCDAARWAREEIRAYFAALSSPASAMESKT